MVGRTPFDCAASIAVPDLVPKYDTLSIALHWLTALLVIVQFALGQTWGWFPRPTRHLMVAVHMSLGIVLTLVLAVRVLRRFLLCGDFSRATAGSSAVSRMVHRLLYVLLAIAAVLGFLSRWVGNEAMSFFGLQIAPPFTGSGQPAAHRVQDIHNWAGWAIIILAAGHALAGLYHHYVLGNRVLWEMLPRGRSGRGPTGRFGPSAARR